MSPQNSHSSLLWIRWHLIFLFCNRFYWSLVPTLKSGRVIGQAYHHAQSNWPMNMRCQMINQLQKSGCEMLLCSNVRDLVMSDSALHTWSKANSYCIVWCTASLLLLPLTVAELLVATSFCCCTSTWTHLFNCRKNCSHPSQKSWGAWDAVRLSHIYLWWFVVKVDTSWWFAFWLISAPMIVWLHV